MTRVPARVLLLLVLLSAAAWAAPARALPPTYPSVSPAASAGQTVGLEQVGSLQGSSLNAAAVAVATRYAYVGAPTGFQIIDIADPSHMRRLGRLPFAVAQGSHSMVVAGDHVYVAGGSLRIVDRRSPNAPVVVGSYAPQTQGNIQGVRLVGQDAYLAAGPAGLRVVDVSEPAHPLEIGSWVGSAVNDLVVAGHYAYLAYLNTLYVLDVTNPRAPRSVGRYSVPDASNGLPVQIHRLALADRYLYLAAATNSCSGLGCGVDAALYVLDLADPVHPRAAGSHALLSTAADLAVVGAYVFIVGSLNTGLEVFNVGNPNQPVPVGNAPFPSMTSIAVAGSQAYITTYADLWAVSVADPAHVSLLGVEAPVHPAVVLSAAPFVYLAQPGYGLRVVNAGDPTHPIEVGSWLNPQIGSAAVDLERAGNYIYIAAGTLGLHVLDIADPEHPIEIASAGGMAGHMVRADHVLYVAAGQQQGLRVIDIADPAHPVLVSQVGLPDAVDVALAGRYAYVAGYEGLRVVDVAPPAAPRVVGSYDSDTFVPDSVAVLGNTVYLAGIYGDVQIVNVTLPTAPALVGSYSISSAYTTELRIGGRYLYYNGGWTVHVFDLQHPTRPVEVATYTPPFFAASVVSDDDIYVGDAQNGLFILRIVVSTTVTPDQGGSLEYTDSRNLSTIIQVPPGAVPSVTELTFVAAPDRAAGAGFVGARHAFELFAAQQGAPQPNFTFTAPVTVTLRYSAADVRVITDAGQLTLKAWIDGGWQDGPATCGSPATAHDLLNQLLSAPICRAGRYMLVGPTHSLLLPIALQRFGGAT